MDNIGKYLIAGSLLGIGAYWLYSKDKSCSDFNNEYQCQLQAMLHGSDCHWINGICESGSSGCSDYNGDEGGCTGAGCYYWSDGTCRSQPENFIPCSDLGGSCNIEGLTRCDGANNKCQCLPDPVNPDIMKFQPVNFDDPDCTAGNTYKDCFKTEDYYLCLDNIGNKSDVCYGTGFGCSCLDGDCSGFGWCEPRVNRCIQQAPYLNISVDNSNWDSCEDSFDPRCTFPGQRCGYSLDNEYAASSLTGTFGWEWGFWGVGLNVRVYGYLDGAGWAYLGENGCEMFGDTGEFQMNLNFSRQGISKLRFDCCNDTPFVNTKPKYFYGTLG